MDNADNLAEKHGSKFTYANSIALSLMSQWYSTEGALCTLATIRPAKFSKERTSFQWPLAGLQKEEIEEGKSVNITRTGKVL